MTMQQPTMRYMAADDIPALVELIKEIRLGFMSMMPRVFIAQYYRNMLHLDNWHCRLLIVDGRIGGFHVLVIGRSANRFQPLYETPIRFIAIACFFVYPALTILKFFLKEREIADEHKKLRAMYDSELVYLGLGGAYQGKGNGHRLMCDMRHVLENEEVAFLGTEFYKDDRQAARFYEKYSYEKLGELNTGGRMSISLRWPVDELPS